MNVITPLSLYRAGNATRAKPYERLVPEALVPITAVYDRSMPFVRYRGSFPVPGRGVMPAFGDDGWPGGSREVGEPVRRVAIGGSVGGDGFDFYELAGEPEKGDADHCGRDVL